MQTASRKAAQLAQAKQIVCNAPAYADRPHVLSAAIRRVRRDRAPRVREKFFSTPQGKAEAAKARQQHAARAHNALATTIATALIVVAVLTITIARTAHLGSLGLATTLEQAEQMRGM